MIPGMDKNISLFHSAQTGTGKTHSPIPRVPWDVLPGLKRPGREAGHSPPYSAEDKNVELDF
jgi:hypothetical protein